VISLRVLKLVLVGLLILTISFKTMRYRSYSSEHYNNTVELITAFLRRHGFQPNGPIAIQLITGASGNLGECHLLIANVAFQGWHQDPLRQFASKEDQLMFFFRGSLYEDQPVWWTTWLSGYWTLFLQDWGVNARLEPVLGIVASPACKLNRMPWQELVDDISESE
jgi:hypothetical protein